jgi:phytanoyl-CoA hydroxylase
MVAANDRHWFERDGYLVLHGFVPASECAALRTRMAELIEAFEPGEVATVFSTTRHSHAQDRYFLDSGDQIRFFFEEEAFDERGRLRQSKAASINKVGHALHDLDRSSRASRAGRSWRRWWGGWALPHPCCCSRCTSSSSRGSAAR